MTDATRKYSEQEIIDLASAINGDESAYKILAENCKELAALCDVLIHDNISALEWLKKNQFRTLLAFISALRQDNDAFSFLLEGDFKTWAATISLIHREEDAREWLIKFDFASYIILAKSIIDWSNRYSPYRRSFGGVGGFSGGGWGGAGGFGGFGGGRFGGGGAGGSW